MKIICFVSILLFTGIFCYPFTGNAEKIVVLTVNKKCDFTSNFWNEYSSKCRGWSLTKTTIDLIIRSRKKITKFDFSYFYDVLPCSYRGDVLIDDKKYHYEIDSGSFLILDKADKYYYYGCSNKQTKKYFILPPTTKEKM